MRAGLGTAVLALVLVSSCTILAVTGAVALSSPDPLDELRPPIAGHSPEPAADASSSTARSISATPASFEGPPCPVGLGDASRDGERDRESDPEPPSEPRIVELYPNPTTRGNVGEYVALSIPPGTRADGENGTERATWTLTDGHTSVALPNGSTAGTVAFSTDPDETAALTTHPVEHLEGHLKLAADGDRVALERDGRVVDRVSYERAPLGEVWYRRGERSGSGSEGGSKSERDDEPVGTWWPRDATCRPAVTTGPGAATAFVLPDSPDVPLETLAAADDRILLAGYTFTSEDVADELRAALERGVAVDVLLESGPVGGTPARTKAVLDDLEAEGATIRILGGRGARYAYHHAKYAVVDDRAIVTTENWKPSGIGGTGSRGWGVVVDGSAGSTVAAELEAVFRADFEGRDTTSWRAHRRSAGFVESDPPGEPFASDIDPESVPVEAVEVLLAPDNAESRTLEHLRAAEESILVEQVRIGDRTLPLLEETLAAARRGVDVKILLDASWYVEDENRALARSLERTADEEGLPLEVRLVEPRNRFEKVHAKGVVIDEERAIVGSINWNENSLRNNREVAVVLYGEAVGEFYADVFAADWEGGSWSLPVSLLGAVAVALVVAALAGRRYVQFGSESGDGSVGVGVGAGVGLEPPAAESGVGSELEATTDVDPITRGRERSTRDAIGTRGRRDESEVTESRGERPSGCSNGERERDGDSAETEE